MTAYEWLRAVAVWSPYPVTNYRTFCTEEEAIEAIGEVLSETFPTGAFSEATVKLVANQCETFPNYYWCCKALENWRHAA
jgi:hypothetical protein